MNFRNAHSNVSICNRALSRLPHPPLASINDTGLAARECRQAYPAVVSALLEMHHWGIATKVAPLVAAEGDTRGWGNVYTLPNDVANPIALHFPDSQLVVQGERERALLASLNQRFEVEGRLIFCDRENAYLRYVSYDVAEDQFPETFVEAISLKLASELAVPITKRADIRDKYASEFTSFLNQALANERNKSGQTYGNAPSESELARQGIY